MRFLKCCLCAERSVYRYLTLFHTTGSVHPAVYISGPTNMLSDFEQFTVHYFLLTFHGCKGDISLRARVWGENICSGMRFSYECNVLFLWGIHVIPT